MAAETLVGESFPGPEFPGQFPDEEIYLFERRYWFVLLQWVWVPGSLTFVLGLVVLVLTSLAALIGHPFSAGTRVLLWILFLSPGCGWIIWRILDWGNDWFIVTDRRVIHIDEIPFIRLRRDEAPLDMIQDVTVHMRGLWQNLLYFGNVVNQTAGTLGTVRFIGIRKPRKVQALILALIGGARRRRAAPPEEAPLREIREVLGFPPREEMPVPPEAEGLRWESERFRRGQLGLVLRRLFLAEPRFGENQIVWRKHWWALLRALVQPTFIFAVIAILWLASGTLFEYSPWVDVFFGLALMGVFTWVVWHTLDWWNDLYVLTDERVVDIEKVPLLAEERREARLDRIQNVRYDQPSLIYRLLNFGHVRLETAGEIGHFTFDYIPHPQEVQAEIFRRLAAFRQRVEEHQRQASRQALLELLGLYHQRTRG